MNPLLQSMLASADHYEAMATDGHPQFDSDVREACREFAETVREWVEQANKEAA